MFDTAPGEGMVFDFDEIADHLVEQGEQLSPSELHGCLTGLLAGGVRGDSAAGLAGLNQALDVDLHGELAALTMHLFQVTEASLSDDEFDFHLLLPDDDTELDIRVLSLGNWCRGFLAGYARALAAAQRGDQALAADSSEILRDIAQISQAGVDDDELPEDESEESYAEIVEYLRFAVLNVFMDTQAQLEASSAASGPASPPSIH